MHIAGPIAQNEGAGGGAPHPQNVCLDFQITDSRFPTPETLFEGFHKPKSVIRDEKQVLARFGPLALTASAPKIFGESLAIPPSYPPSFVPNGPTVFLEIRIVPRSWLVSRFLISVACATISDSNCAFALSVLQVAGPSREKVASLPARGIYKTNSHNIKENDEYTFAMKIVAPGK